MDDPLLLWPACAPFYQSMCKILLPWFLLQDKQRVLLTVNATIPPVRRHLHYVMVCRLDNKHPLLTHHDLKLLSIYTKVLEIVLGIHIANACTGQYLQIIHNLPVLFCQVLSHAVSCKLACTAHVMLHAVEYTTATIKRYR